MGETVWMPGPLRVEIKLGGAQTGGAFCLLVDHPPPGWALPAHTHAREAETILVEAGRFEMVVDGERTELGPGDLVHVPAGMRHEGRALHEHGEGRRTLIFSPAGMEAFFRAAGAATPEEQRDLATLARIAGEHGWRFG